MFKYILLVALLLAVAVAQNTTCTSAENRNSCFKCMSTGGACFYCSSLGCRANTPADHTACTDSDGSATNAISACPDPCYNPDNNGCTDCLTSSCGYCSSSGSCMTGTSTGPSYKTCGTWRFKSSTSTLSNPQVCSTYQSCSAITNCDSCRATAQDANTPCNWCTGTGGGSCVAGTTCPSGANRASSCPTPDTSDACTVTAGVVSFVGFMAALGL
eukprot:TRINITY_DN669_c0_g1_i1.p1 TRINITY_DN669_c0_g1~~TRINITY_DN669_c0_g1_i1.p1  ORF type:complete len:215 (-),score=18.82 TRINITY_DN669_c0_g1_i1:129-773(-)